MKKKEKYNTGRRNFITTTIPLCAGVLFIDGYGVAAVQKFGNKFIQSDNIFEKKIEKELSYSEYYTNQYKEFIRLAKMLEKEWGKDKVIEFLKKNTEERSLKTGKSQAENMNDNSFAKYVEQFRPPNYKNLLVHEVVENSETVFELKVTKCIWAEVFNDAQAGDIGFAHICYGDYFWPRGFNPKIKMERDKTLMQGCAYCNHRYILET